MPKLSLILPCMGKRKRQIDVWNRGKSYTSKSDHIALDNIFGRLTTIDGIVHIESSHNARLGKKHSKRRLSPLSAARLAQIKLLTARPLERSRCVKVQSSYSKIVKGLNIRDSRTFKTE